MLLPYVANVDAGDECGLTPLMAAAATGAAGTVRLLLESGASVHARDALGMTALHAAANAGQYDCAYELLRSSAPIDAATDDGATPLELLDERAPRFAEFRSLLAGETLVHALAEADDDGYASGGSFKSYDSAQDDRRGIERGYKILPPPQRHRRTRFSQTRRSIGDD